MKKKKYFEAEEWRTLIKWCTLKNHNSQSTMTCVRFILNQDLYQGENIL